MSALLWLLLPVAALSGWVAATKHYNKLKKRENNKLPLVYEAPSINSDSKNFVSTQPDKAIDIVLDKLEVNTETVEVHLALGKLYRKSGEVNRAIRFHQNLIEKHALSNAQRESILFELGRDYLAAGLLDRAERIFIDLLTTSEFKKASSKALIEVYQHEKEWDSALEYAELYETLSQKSQSTRIGHYLCEKAESSNDAEDQSALLFLALKRDKFCVRANILLGKIKFDQLKPDDALSHYLAVVDQDSAYLSIVFEPIVQCFQLISESKALLTVLPNSIESKSEHMLNLPYTENGVQAVNYKKAIKIAEQQLDQKPTLSLLRQYIMLSLDDVKLTDRKLINKLKDALYQISKNSATFQCIACGVGVHGLHWQCPSCANWSTVKPI